MTTKNYVRWATREATTDGVFGFISFSNMQKIDFFY